MMPTSNMMGAAHKNCCYTAATTKHVVQHVRELWKRNHARELCKAVGLEQKVKVSLLPEEEG